MKIFFLLSIFIVVVLFFGKKFFYSAKSNLFKDQAAWSGKDIKIKYSNSTENIESKRKNNFLRTVANESKIYLDNQSSTEDDESR